MLYDLGTAATNGLFGYAPAVFGAAQNDLQSAALRQIDGARAMTDKECYEALHRQYQWFLEQQDRRYAAMAHTLDARFADFRQRLGAAISRRTAD